MPLLPGTSGLPCAIPVLPPSFLQRGHRACCSHGMHGLDRPWGWNVAGASASHPSQDILMWSSNTSSSFKQIFQSLFSYCCVLTAVLSEPPQTGLEECGWSPAPLNVPKAAAPVLVQHSPCSGEGSHHSAPRAELRRGRGKAPWEAPKMCYVSTFHLLLHHDEAGQHPAWERCPD